MLSFFVFFAFVLCIIARVFFYFFLFTIREHAVGCMAHAQTVRDLVTQGDEANITAPGCNSSRNFIA